MGNIWDDMTGRTQRKKTRDRVQWAQNAYNEAGRLKNEYTSHVEPHLKHIETALQAAMNQCDDSLFPLFVGSVYFFLA